MKTRTIHHFEDEPEFVRWIPGTLFNLYWRRHPDWVVPGSDISELGDDLASFNLSVGTEQWLIEYRLYSTVEAFQQRFTGHAKPRDVVLVDLMNASREHPGTTVYAQAVETLGSKAVYFLTSFPDEVGPLIAVPDGHILPKPVDAANLTRLLMDALAIT